MMRDHLSFSRFVRLALLAAVVTAACFGQASGTIAGRVTDAQQGVIVGATVNIESPELAVSRSLQTTQEGTFSVPNLPVGIYNLKVTASGFGPWEQKEIKLDVGSVLNKEILLQVGSTATEVTVSGGAFQTVNTETANVESLVSGTQVRELALNGRNWAQLINLAPGTAAINQDTQQGTNVRIDDTAINGTRRRFAPTLDGISNVDHGSVATLVNNISIDAIEEFKLVSTPYSAEYGGQAGAGINVVTKRGTTQFHGSLFEFFRNDKLNAYSWESKQVTGTPKKARLRFNNPGAFLGGPLYKSRLFFFGGAEWKLPRTGTSLSEQVPTLAMRTGDFSALLPTTSGAITSCTQTLSAADKSAGKVILCDKSGATAVPFAGNIIPTTKMSPNGRAIINLFPKPNSGLATYIDSPVTTRNVRQDMLRGDWMASQAATVYARWTRDTFDSDNPLGSTFDNQNLPIAPDNHRRIGSTAMMNYTHVLGATLVNELTAAWQRNDQEVTYQNVADIDRTQHGISFTEIYSQNRLNKMPEVALQGYSTISGNGLPYTIDAQAWEFRDNLSKQWGAHSLKAGVMYLRAFKQENTRVRDGGTLTFSSGADATFTAQDSGNAVANLLLGAYQRYAETSNTTAVPSHYNQWEFYLNDQWRVRSNLTFTLGLRYQYIPWPIADDGRIVSFDPNRFDSNKAPLSSDISSGVIKLIADPTGKRTRAEGYYDPYNGLVLPGCDNRWSDPNLTRLLACNGDNLATSGTNGWAPRFGFAWDPFKDQKTSIRGGAGVYYDRTLLNPVRDAGVNAPFTQISNITNGRQYTTPVSLVPTFSNTLDTVGASGAGQPLLQQLAVFSGTMRPGALYAYSFGIQRQLPFTSVIEVNYVGNQARFLTHRRDINYVRPEIALQIKPSNGAFLNPTTDTVRPYLGYTAINQQSNDGVSNYNSLQASFQKRTTRGLTISGAYTFSKALNTFDTETSNLRVPYSQAADYGHADFDRRHVLALSYVWELPFYKSRRHFTGKAFGGWQISGTSTRQSGKHVSMSGGTRASTAPSIGYGGNTDLIGNWRDVPAGYPSQQWINPQAFQPRGGFIAFMPRNLIEMPATLYWNLSVTKKTRVNERVTLQFRAESFNFLNHPNFKTVQTNFSSSNFGQLTETDDPRAFQFGLKVLF